MSDETEPPRWVWSSARPSSPIGASLTGLETGEHRRLLACRRLARPHEDDVADPGRRMGLAPEARARADEVRLDAARRALAVEVVGGDAVGARVRRGIRDLGHLLQAGGAVGE